MGDQINFFSKLSGLYQVQILMVGDLVSGDTFDHGRLDKNFSKLSGLYQVQILVVGDLVSGGTFWLWETR